jgi:hypothetical protein
LHLDEKAPPALQNGRDAPASSVSEFLKKAQTKAGDGFYFRGGYNERELAKVPAAPMGTQAGASADRVLAGAQVAKENLDYLRRFNVELQARNLESLQAGRYGVAWSQQSINLRNQAQCVPTAQRWLGNRNCVEVGGVWIDEAYEAAMPTCAVKAMSPAYFRILERQPNMKNIFRISNHMVWVTPNRTALVIDTGAGQEEISDAEIDRLFVAKK